MQRCLAAIRHKRACCERLMQCGTRKRKGSSKTLELGRPRKVAPINHTTSTRQSLLFGLQPSSSRFLADVAGGLSRSGEAINYVSFSCAPSSFDFPLAHTEEVMISSLWSVQT